MSMELISRLIDVPSTDPEDARRGRLLNMLLAFTVVIVILGLIATFIFELMGQESEAGILYQAGAVMLVSLVIIYLINRYWLGWVASALFLLIFVFVLSFDNPVEVVNGRTLFLFAIPILMGSIVLRPIASIFVSIVVTAVIIIIASFNNLTPNLIGSLGLIAIGFLAWLSARSLEQALEDVQTINRELDQRVNDRTQDLAAALAREHGEASKNQTILESIADGVIVFNSEDKAIVANPAISHLLTVPNDQIIDRSIAEIMGQHVSQANQSLVLDMLKDKAVNRPPMKLDWDEKTLSISLAPLQSFVDGSTGTVAVFRDFTREAEIDQMKSDFVSIASHELRTPLTSIKGYLDLVIHGSAGKINPKQEEFLHIAKNNTERLHLLVKDLLDVSRIESGKIDLDVQLISIHAIINTAVRTVRNQFEERNLSLEVDLPADLPNVFGDPNRITQILINLLSNAYKYTQEGGATVRARLTGNAVQIDIADTGLGISAEDQEKLFTRFFRAGDSAVRQQSGTGLGLNITKSLVEMHGGETWITSKLNKGTTASFTMPLPAGLTTKAHSRLEVPQQNESEQTPETPDVGSNHNGTHIMVVDDDIEIARLFQHRLQIAGYKVTVQPDSKNIVAITKEIKPDLITLDLLMEVDGLSVLEQLKAEEETKNIPVVVISVVSEPEKGLSLGAADYLTKPVDREALLNSVGNIFEQLDQAKMGSKILVVDDDKDIASWLKHALDYYGFNVSTAYDGLQCLESVANSIPDLILLDMMMPRMDGSTTIRKLREEERSRHIPIIVLSANPPKDGEERTQLIGAGVKEFLKKPVPIEDVVVEIEKHLNSLPQTP
jgi:signal transduction histidine kinase/CheY-like chemotaxis protein